VHYRRLGRTGLEVSEIGYGAWGIGKSQWLGAEDDESLRALRRAIDLGLNFIDTALSYGEGHSERLVGQVVRERGERVYVATKIPPKNRKWPATAGLHPDETFPADHVRECTEMSLENLGLDAIDVQQFHVWHEEWVGEGDWLEAVEDLKKEGEIRYVLSHPAVSAVIPGMRSVRNVERNMAVGDGGGLPEDQVQRLKGHRWVRNFYA
jgi:aryl-alcohol dehydrogenase-like predicted oxidoreductase